MTIGERTFEQYLVSQGITDYQFEKLPKGKKRPPDYTITRGREYLFEVKDFEPRPVAAGPYDPHTRLRSKIDAARKKFQEYEGWPCSLVLYNNGADLVDIKRPNIVLGAMYGDAGIVIPFNPQTGKATGEEYQAFLTRGKMVRPHWKEPENTRISALITLRYVHVGKMRIQQHVSQITTNAVGRAARAVDIYQQLSAAKLDFDPEEKHLGVIVWENAFASIPFPRDLFCGDYDETYGVVGGQQPRVFAGKSILAYEELASSFHSPTIFDITRKTVERSYQQKMERKRKRSIWQKCVFGVAVGLLCLYAYKQLRENSDQ